MLFKKLILSVLILLGFGITSIKAQESINASGGKASGSGGNVTYSVGQVVYTTITGTNGFVVGGVQQPYEISVVIGIKENENINLNYSVYPNPTSNNLQLKVENENLVDFSYQLYDITGKHIDNKKIESSLTSIDMSYLVSATYFIKVIQRNKELKIFKIIKN